MVFFFFEKLLSDILIIQEKGQFSSEEDGLSGKDSLSSQRPLPHSYTLKLCSDSLPGRAATKKINELPQYIYTPKTV